MDPVRAFAGKSARMVQPAREGHAQADGRAYDATAFGQRLEGAYAAWSGTSMTLHRRLMCDVSGHGCGTEMV